jgi:hypothetical protein
MIPGLTIGGLFALTRRAAREVRMEEVRRFTMSRAHPSERDAQKKSLDRMRDITSAQLRSTLMEQGVSPMAFMGQDLGPDSPAASAYIAEAAAMPSRQG